MSAGPNFEHADVDNCDHMGIVSKAFRMLIAACFVVLAAIVTIFGIQVRYKGKLLNVIGWVECVAFGD